HAWLLRQQAAYVTLSSHLAELIPDVEASAESLEGDNRYRALRLVVHSYNATSSLLKRVGDVQLALIAADRAVRTADLLDDPILSAAANCRLANVFLSASRLDEARQVALNAADSITLDNHSQPVALASWGGLLLTGAVASARMADAPAAWELLGEARAAS